MRFWYYKNGGVEGETVEVKPAGGVKIAGTEYQSAFEFPIVGDGEFVGVKFSAPVMPMSPSARIHIDYASAKKVADIGSAAATATNTAAPAKPTESAKGEASLSTAGFCARRNRFRRRNGVGGERRGKRIRICIGIRWRIRFRQSLG